MTPPVALILKFLAPFWSHFGDLCLFNNGWWRWMHIIQTASKVHIVIEDPEPVTALLKGGPQLHHSQWPTSTMMYQAIWRDKLWSKHQKMISTNNMSFSDTCPHWSSMKMNVARCSTHNTHTHTKISALFYSHFWVRLAKPSGSNSASRTDTVFSARPTVKCFMDVSMPLVLRGGHWQWSLAEGINQGQ